MTVRQTLWLGLKSAIAWEESYIEANRQDTDACAQSQKLIDAYKSLLVKLFGTWESGFERAMASTPGISLHDLKTIFKEILPEGGTYIPNLPVPSGLKTEGE
jgi:hypothetical protein